jgi:hypothetical protein
MLSIALSWFTFGYSIRKILDMVSEYNEKWNDIIIQLSDITPNTVFDLI